MSRNTQRNARIFQRVLGVSYSFAAERYSSCLARARAIEVPTVLAAFAHSTYCSFAVMGPHELDDWLVDPARRADAYRTLERENFSGGFQQVLVVEPCGEVVEIPSLWSPAIMHSLAES